LDDSQPSDADLLIVSDTDDERIALHAGAELFDILGRAYDRHIDAPRDVMVMCASRTLMSGSDLCRRRGARWHSALARGPLSAPLATVA
jgi:hypothetical protein